jgi:hypothetical protein
MAYLVKWLVEGRVICNTPNGIVTADDIKSSYAQIHTLLDAGQPYIHVITDATHMEQNTIGLGDLIGIINSAPSSPNMGWSIYISKSKLDRFFASVSTQINQTRSREFNNIADGIAFLQEQDPTLPPIPLP